MKSPTLWLGRSAGQRPGSSLAHIKFSHLLTGQAGRAALRCLSPMKTFTLLLAAASLLAAQLPLHAQTGGTTEEQSLIAVLQSDHSAHDKDAACSRLKHIGTEAAIPALAELLTDDQLSHSARYVLEAMTSEKAEQALIEALPKTAGASRVGIINSLGERADQRAVTPMAALLANPDATTAAAAAETLGKIGGQEAQHALDAVLNQASGPVRDAVVDALLRCATASHDRAEFEKMYKSEKSETIRTAAYRGWIQNSGEQALKLVIKGVRGKDPAAQTAALQLAREIQAPGATAALVKLLHGAPVAVQISLIDALDQRGDPAAAPAILALTATTDPDVRLACLNVLGNLGGGTAVPVLAKFASAGSVAEKRAAREALVDLRQGDVTTAMLQALPKSAPAEQLELGRAIGHRGDAKALPELLKLAAQGTGSVRESSLQALAELAGGADLPALVQLVTTGTDDSVRTTAAGALNAVLRRLQSNDIKPDLAPIAAAMQTSSPEVRVALLPICGRMADEQSRSMLRQSLADADARVRAAAAQVLWDTTDPKLSPDLLKLAHEAGTEDLRKLAVGGSVRLMTQEADVKLPNGERIEAFKNLLADPLDAAEKRTVLAGLATIKDTAALELTLSLVDDPAVHKEASQAAQQQTPHTFKKIKLTDQFWSEGANFGDFNHDGKMDIVSGPYWYEAPDFKKRHEYRPATASFKRAKANGDTETIPGFQGALGTNNAYSDDFLTFVYDFNGDGWPDILVIDFPGKAARWYENPKGASGHWTSHLVTDTVDDESPTFLDINGDGKPELVCISGGCFGYAAADWSDPTKPWKFHAISPKDKNRGKFTHGLGVGDVNGDGRMDLLEKDGWWEQPASLENDPVWTFHPFPFAPGGAAQMFAYDVNGDGLNDVITCLNPHGYGLVWWEQMRDGTNITFKQHIIMGKDEAASRFGAHFSQPHSMALVDVDGDGLLDIVTGKRFWAHGPNGPDPESHGSPALLYWFQLVRHAHGQADYIPHLIDDDSGVGTQVVAGNVTNQKYPDVVVGNKKGTFLFTHEFKP